MDDQVRKVLEEKFGKGWNPEEFIADFVVVQWAAPLVTVVRKSDGKQMQLGFQDVPRFYFVPRVGQIHAALPKKEPAKLGPKRVTNTKKMDPTEHLMSAMVLGSSGSILSQESRGRYELVESDQIPILTRGFRDDQLESLGFKLSPPDHEADPLFRVAVLPPGWKKVLIGEEGTTERGGGQMFIVDQNGFRRFNMFYKAAFYDRKADMKVIPRFRLDHDYSDDAYDKGEVKYTVMAQLPGGEERSLFSALQVLAIRRPANDAGQEKFTEFFDARDRTEDLVKAQCTEWLAEKYPDPLNPLLHWEAVIE